MKKIKPISLLLCTTGIALLCSSCTAEDRTMSRFDEINAKIEENSSKIDVNNTKIVDNYEKLQDVIDILETPEKTILQIKNEQIGLSLMTYFDACARCPEAYLSLNTARDFLYETMDNELTVEKIYGIASTYGASNNNPEFFCESGSGIFDAIARQPERAQQMISFQKSILTDAILKQESEICAKMIGYGTTSIFDAIARQPEITEKLIEYATYIIDSFSNLEDEESAYCIGYASASFYSAVARQPEFKEQLFESFKDLIDKKIKK